MNDVQARPSELSSFYTTETAAANQLETDRDTLDNAFIAFRNAPGGGVRLRVTLSSARR